jgi:ADP-heptose:LPS heptosyltransferase
VLDYQGLLRSAWLAKLCRAKTSRVFGLGDAREGARFFYDQIVDVRGQTHAVDRYLALTRAAGAAVPEAEQLEWRLPAGALPAGFDADEPFVVLHPFSRGAGKSLDIAQVEEFCRPLAPYRVVIAGRAEAAVPSGCQNGVDLLNRTTITELIALLRRAAFVVSVDSGPMHIAAALTSRLVSIHTWSDPAKVGPYRADAWVWQSGRLFRQVDRANFPAHREIANIGALAELVRSML